MSCLFPFAYMEYFDSVLIGFVLLGIITKKNHLIAIVVTTKCCKNN